METWLDHPGKVALIGAFLVLLGQFGATLFPILLGPDLSDYNLFCDPAYHEIVLNNTLPMISGKNYLGECSVFDSAISIKNLNPFHKYTYQVSLVESHVPGFSILMYDPIVSIDRTASLRIIANVTYLRSRFGEDYVPQKYPITIQGIGADGKSRNCTIIVMFADRDYIYLTTGTWLENSSRCYGYYFFTMPQV